MSEEIANKRPCCCATLPDSRCPAHPWLLGKNKIHHSPGPWELKNLGHGEIWIVGQGGSIHICATKFIGGHADERNAEYIVRAVNEKMERENEIRRQGYAIMGAEDLLKEMRKHLDEIEDCIKRQKAGVHQYDYQMSKTGC